MRGLTAECRAGGHLDTRRTRHRTIAPGIEHREDHLSLLRTECDERIHVARPSRRGPSGSGGHRDQQQRHRSQCRGIERGYLEEQARKGLRKQQRGQQPNDHSRASEADGTAHDHPYDAPLLGPHRDA